MNLAFRLFELSMNQRSCYTDLFDTKHASLCQVIREIKIAVYNVLIGQSWPTKLNWDKSEAISFNKIDLKDSFETKNASLAQILSELA